MSEIVIVMLSPGMTIFVPSGSSQVPVTSYMPQVMTAWLALYGAARHSPKLNRILGVYHRRLHSNLKHALLGLHSPAKAEQLAIGIAALIDGVWLRAALTDDTGNRQQALSLIESYIDAQAGIAL